jgi:hypothetical protein
MKRPINQSGFNSEQKAAAADAKPTAKVSFTEVPPDANQLVQHLRKDPERYAQLLAKYSARQIEDAPYVQKGKKRAELETKTLAAANQTRQREAVVKRDKIRELARKILAENPRLSSNRLAKKINETNPSFSVRTIRRALGK